jgi:uncharacterized small protein (DUF1192 family)
MRLSMDEARKQHDGIKKLYEQGLRGAIASVEQVLDLFDTIEALQQEIENLKATLTDWKYNAKCDADHIATLTTDRDELVRVLKQARDAINGYSTCPYCWGVNGHAKGCKFYEALQNIDALIGGKDI